MARHSRFLAWQRARSLTLGVYRVSGRWPTHERYGLTSQARRAAVSVCANIAEGAARHGRPEFARFLSIAAGSLGELACLLDIAHGLGYLNDASLAELNSANEETGRLIGGLRRSLVHQRLTPNA